MSDTEAPSATPSPTLRGAHLYVRRHRYFIGSLAFSAIALLAFAAVASGPRQRDFKQTSASAPDTTELNALKDFGARLRGILGLTPPPPPVLPTTPQPEIEEPEMEEPIEDVEPPPPPTQAPVPRPTLYCLSIVYPVGYEVGLMKNIFQKKAGIFECEESAVFSNFSFAIAPGLNTYPIGGDMHVEHGGKWGTALNTDVFVQLWKVVASQNRAQLFDWTIKVDPDAVLLPERFRDLVSCGPECGIKGATLPVPKGAVFLNNCKWGMHGGVEAMSKQAMQLFLANIDNCENIRMAGMDINQPPGLAEKDHAFGEDQYLRRCLRQLGVNQVDEYPTLLSELRACGRPYPADCGGVRTAFHAMKTIQTWNYCHMYATTYGRWPKGLAKKATR